MNDMDSLFIGIFVVGASLKDLHGKELSPLDKTGGCRPLFLDNLDINEAKVCVTIGIDWKTLVIGVWGCEGSHEHPGW